MAPAGQDQNISGFPLVWSRAEELVTFLSVDWPFRGWIGVSSFLLTLEPTCPRGRVD